MQRHKVLSQAGNDVASIHHLIQGPLVLLVVTRKWVKFHAIGSSV